MKVWRPRSLRGRLVVRLVLLQAVLVLLAGLLPALILLSAFGVTGTVADPRDSLVVGDALYHDAGGVLRIENTPALQQLRQDAPGLWFIARDQAGHEVAEGAVPPDLTVADLPRLENSIFADYLRTGEFSVRARSISKSDTTINVLTGGGRMISIWVAVIRSANQFLLAFVVLLSASTIVAVPWIIRREMRGVVAAAGQAELIDIKQPGVRLPTDNLPSEATPLVNAVNAALQRLDDGYLQQQRFLAAAAHELKTPIAILQTRIETTVDPQVRAPLLLDVARLNTLAEQLLDIQRLDHVAVRTRIDFVSLCQRVAADMAPLAIATGYDLEFQGDIASYPIQGDDGAIERAVTNLVQNAIVHGGGTGKILLHVLRDGVLEVSDDGAGIPADHRDKVFEPFFRGRTGGQGSGLGLSLVRDIVHHHGGFVSATRSASGGAALRMHIPQHKPS